MTSITFDTLKYAERLEEAGVSREQAKAFAEAQRESIGEIDLATKADLNEVESRLNNQLTEIRGELKLSCWMLAIIIAVNVLPILKNIF